MKVVAGIIAALLMLSCARIPKADSSLNSTFVQVNTAGFPELITTNKVIGHSVNRQLIALAQSWQCVDGGDSSFKILRHTLSTEYLSVEYEAMQYCEGMPTIESVNTAITFSMTDGEEVTLEALTQCSTLNQIEQKIEVIDVKPRLNGCPVPEFSDQFFLDKNTITLLNFYPFHFHTSCEFTITKQLSDIACQ